MKSAGFARKSQRRGGIAIRLRPRISKLRVGLGRALYGAGVAVLGAGTVLVSAVAVYSIVHSSYFRLQDVEVRGTERITGTQVMRIAGLAKRPTIFDIPIPRIEAVLARNPWVDEVLARRKFPDRLIVDVKERSPRAIVHLGELHYVDREGVVFKRVARGETMNFPVLTGLESDEAVSPEGRELLARALELVELWEAESRLGQEQLSEIHIERERGFSVITRTDGMEIQFGLDNFPLKMETLTKLLDRLEEQQMHARHIDLSFRNLAVVRSAAPVESKDTVGL